MGDHEPPTELENFACVETYVELEQEVGPDTIHVEFWDQLDLMYTQLLETIRMHGYEVVHFEQNERGRLEATFIETEPHTFHQDVWDWEDPPEWVDDLPL